MRAAVRLTPERAGRQPQTPDRKSDPGEHASLVIVVCAVLPTDRGFLVRLRIRAAAFWLASASLVAGLAAAPTADAARTTQAASYRWRIAYTTGIDRSSFHSVLAFSRSNVWAIGYITPYQGNSTSLIRRWNGHSWSATAVPRKFDRSTPTVAADSSARDIWMFGEYATDNGARPHVYALRWNGSWSVRGLWPTDEPIDAAAVISPSDVWVFGLFGTRHYNGHTWTKFKMHYTITAASAISASDIWAVGTDNQFESGTPALLHWSGGTWTSVPLPKISSAPGQPQPELFSVLAAPRRELWVAGNTWAANGQFRPLVLRRSGGKWQRLSPPAKRLDGLGDIVPDGSGGVWVGAMGPADASAVGHFTGGRWHIMQFPARSGTATSAFSLALVPRSKIVYGVGLRRPSGPPPYQGIQGLIARYSR